MALGGKLKLAIARVWRTGQRLRGMRDGMTILYYHAVPDADADNFIRQMEHLAAHANCVFADADPAPQGGQPRIAVTFDDAFKSVANNALPIMAELKIPATIFVPTKWMGRTPGWQMETGDDASETVMNAEELRAILSPLVRLGSHTVAHPRMSRLSIPEQRDQLVNSRVVLEELSGSVIDTLAFPYGDYDDRTVECARNAGFRHVYTIMPQTLRIGNTDLVRGRTSVEASDPLALFDLKMNGAFEWMPLAVSIKRSILGRRTRT